MAFATTDKPSMETLLAQRLNERLAEKGMSILQLADAVQSTYEYMRRLCRGSALPSKYVLRSVASVLDLDYDELDKLRVEDTLRHKYGKTVLTVRGKNPMLEPFEKMVPLLEKQQREHVITIMETFIKNNRKRKHG